MPELTIPNLFARRSVRKYTTKPVTDEQIDMLLKAAMASPSAANKQPWHWIVVQSQETLSKIAEFHPYGKMTASASVCIVACGDPDLRGEGTGEAWMIDVAAACENLLLAASAMDLGAVWLGVYPDETRAAPAREALGIPEDIHPLAFLVIGYPDEDKEARTQYNAERVHKERW